MVFFRSIVSQRFIMILVCKLILFKESILGCVESSFQIEWIWLDLLCHYQTLSFHIWFCSLENLLGLIIFTALITDFFIDGNWSIITGISTSNWVLTGSINSSPDFGVNSTLWSSSGVWTRSTHLSSHQLWSTLAVIFGLPENRIFLGLFLWFLLSSVHIVNVSPSSWGVMFVTQST